MHQQSQGPSFLTPSDAPMKRKRGRPRKDENILHTEGMPARPGCDSVIKSKQIEGTSDDHEDEMVGQIVTGVIEGTFDAGYLLNVKVGNTDSHLRGVVFLPGKYTPITEANDVAPHVKTVKRKEIPIPVLNPQTQLLGLAPSGQSRKQPLQSQVPNVQDQVLQPELRSGSFVAHSNQSAPTIVPMANLPKNDTNISFVELLSRTLEPGQGVQSVSATSQSKNDKGGKEDELLHGFEASTQLKGLDCDLEANKKLETTSEPLDLILSIDNTNKEHELINHEPRSSSIELNQAPMLIEPASVSLPHNISSLQREASLEKDLSQNTKAEPVIETPKEVDTSNFNGRPITHAVNAFGDGSNPSLNTSYPAILSVGVSLPSDSNFTTEGCGFPGMRETHMCSSVGITNMESSFQDVIPPSQAQLNLVEPREAVGSKGT